MTRILVVPERLHDLSRQMNQTASELHNLEGHLGRALGGLDWQVRQQANVEGQVRAAQGQARALAERAEAMARFLAERATAFQQADAECAQDLQAVTEPYLQPVPVPVPTPTSPHLPSPNLPAKSELERLLNTLLALEPVALKFLLKKLGVGTIKDIFDLLQIQKYMDEMERARDAWVAARLQYGKDSPQAMAAQEKYYDMYGKIPIIGPFIQALLDMGRANPVY